MGGDKTALPPGLALAEGARVWHLSEHDHGCHLQAGTADVFVLRLQEMAAAGYTWSLDPLPQAGFAVIADSTEPAPDDQSIGGPTLRQIIATHPLPGRGTLLLEMRRAWETDGEAAGQVAIGFEVVDQGGA